MPTNELSRTHHPPTSLSLNPDPINPVKPTNDHQSKLKRKPRSQQTQSNLAPTIISFSKPSFDQTYMTVKKKKEKNSSIDVKERDSNYNIESKQ